MISRGALALIDLLLGGSIESAAIAAPPTTPEPGTFYRVASGATGAFTAHDNQLAGWSDGGWRFVAPVEGMCLTDRISGMEVAYRGGAWTSGSVHASELLINGVKVVGQRAAAIADPAGGSVVDTQTRAVVTALLAALRAHGLVAT